MTVKEGLKEQVFVKCTVPVFCSARRDKCKLSLDLFTVPTEQLQNRCAGKKNEPVALEHTECGMNIDGINGNLEDHQWLDKWKEIKETCSLPLNVTGTVDGKYDERTMLIILRSGSFSGHPLWSNYRLISNKGND